MKPGDFYRHYKGNIYVFLGLATHSETGDKLVLYQPYASVDHTVWARPYERFFETLSNGQPRFELTSNE